MNSLSLTLLEETKSAFAELRGSTLEAMQKLFQVKTAELWKQVAGSWGEYVESELGISQGFASKLLTVHDHYLLKAGISQEKLTGVDYEKLYLASKLTGSPEEQIEKARVLTRQELKLTRNDEEIAPHQPEWVEFCKTCNVSRANHS